MTYQDFDLLIVRTADGLRAEVLSSPAGTAAVEFTLPLSEDKIENCLLRLGRTHRGVRRVESSEMQTAKEFGAALFESVFSRGVGERFRDSVEAARRQGTGLRLRLRLSAPELADLPWEFLYNPSVNRFPALSIRTPLVRYIDLPEKVQPVPVAQPLRALVMISSPKDYPQLDVESEWARLTGSLKALVDAGLVAIDRLDNATLSDLQRCLRRARYHIFHFIGHGEFDRSSEEGVLILEREDRAGHRVGSQYLGMLLHDHESLRLAILNACEGARTSRVDPFAGTAQTLVQQGIPAVIAMQFEIADDVAGTFAHEFYGAVADGYPIDAAVTEARKAIFAAGRDVEWGTPVLYLRAPDGRIFDVAHTSGAPAGPHGLGDAADLPATALNTAAEPKERAAALARSAGVALANGEFAEALQYLQEARELDPDAPNLRDLTDTAEEQRAVAATRAHRRRRFQEHLAAARDLCDRGDVAAASRRLGEALALRPQDPGALALRDRIRAAERPPAQRAASDRPNATREAHLEHAVPAAVRAPAETMRAKDDSKPQPDKPLDDERDLID